MNLIPFPGTTAPYKLSGEAQLNGSVLNISFELSGPVKDLKKMASISKLKNRKTELWKSTCFEFFIKPQGKANYWECNISPDGDWNLYRLSDYRKDLAEEASITEFSVRAEQASADRWKMFCTIDLSPLKIEKILLNLSAVLENQNGEKTYWSLAHTQKQADFHHQQHFIINLSKESAT